ncbi:efflux transporter outer membrane subunit [Phenylobacterium sp.]|uniref:efflux transporter outer membrane subunit n=1 Tax=Phenylobacterium sp. TaxID=1871053 RepID=UPI00272FD832|nr:TolC family protein [Phenylobacterium sp.]MDP2215297.1 TolC family protein [Phenylobacterium sp.]
MRLSTAFALLAGLTLSACATPRDAQIALPEAFPLAAEASSGQTIDQWWLAFDDPELTALVEEALARSPDAQSAAARLREARLTASSALTAFLPQGQLTGSARRTETEQIDGQEISIPGLSTSGTTEAYQANFNVSWELDLFGRFFAARRAARGDTAAARFAYEGARASLAANVADAYFQARGLAIQLDDARESARIQRSLYDVADRRVELGLAARLDSDRVAGELAQAESQVQALQAELQAQQRTLLVLVGRGTAPLDGVSTPPLTTPPPPVPATLPGELLARRPDVREAEARVRSAAGRLTYAQLAFFPTFTLTPGLGISRNDQPGYSATTQNWSIGAGVSQPVLNIPRLMLDLKAQDARTEQAVIAYEKVVQTAYAEAESALVRLAADRRRVDLLSDGAVRAERAYESARLGYDAGLTDLNTALGAEQIWRATRAQHTGALVQAQRRAVQAYKALGGGWPSQSLPPNTQAR